MKTSHKGFTLVEMAIALVIGATILTAGLKIATIWAERAAISTTQKHQEAIKQALISYLGANGRLPCPDSIEPLDNKDDDERAAGCANFGTIPFITLGLDRDTVMDGWDNYFTYMVSPNWLMTYDKTLAAADGKKTPIIGDAFWAGASNGLITVYDRYPADSPATKIGNPLNNTGAAVAIISHGRNGAGSINVNLVRADNPPANTDELVNVTFNPALSVYKHQLNEVAETAGGIFDDVVLTLSKNDIVEPLVSNGTYRNATPKSIINEANDLYVTSKIIPTKRSCPQPPLLPKCSLMGTLNESYYYTISPLVNQLITGSDNAIAWGASSSAADIVDVIIDAYTDSAATAYFINANGADPSPYTINELKANLARMSGF